MNFGSGAGSCPRRTASNVSRSVLVSHKPSQRLGVVKTAASMQDLQDALKMAVLMEDYAEAAVLRDKIQAHPDNAGENAREQLEAAMQEAVAEENFKEAAKLKEELSKLPQKQDTSSSSSTGELTYHSIATTRGIRVEARSAYIPQRSSPDRRQYFFVYQIKIVNESSSICQLQNRRWLITDGSGDVEEVKGPGVIGQQPVMGPSHEFEYTSACPLKTESGVMEGEFECIIIDDEGNWGDVVQVKVAPFLLTTSVVGQIQGM